MLHLYRTVYAAADTACKSANDAAYVCNHTFNDTRVTARVSRIRLIHLVSVTATAAVSV
jgi:hypothetical protein